MVGQERESGRRWVEREMTRLALTHAAGLLRSVAHDVTTAELRAQLLRAADQLDQEAGLTDRVPVGRAAI